MIIDFHTSEPGMPGEGFDSENINEFVQMFKEWLTEWVEAVERRPEQLHEVRIRITK